jgi:hypothetical protein
LPSEATEAREVVCMCAGAARSRIEEVSTVAISGGATSGFAIRGVRGERGRLYVCIAELSYVEEVHSAAMKPFLSLSAG